MNVSSITRNAVVLTPVFMLLAAMLYHLFTILHRWDGPTVLDIAWKAAVLILLLRLNWRS